MRECSPTTTCHMSRVRCHMSCVRCRMSCVTCNIFIFFGQSGEAYRWRVCYHRGLPRLIYKFINSMIWQLKKFQKVKNFTQTLNITHRHIFINILSSLLLKTVFSIMVFFTLKSGYTNMVLTSDCLSTG